MRANKENERLWWAPLGPSWKRQKKKRRVEDALSSIQGLLKELTVMTYETQLGLQTVKTSFIADTKELLHEHEH
jgi:hypothetical protein